MQDLDGTVYVSSRYGAMDASNSHVVNSMSGHSSRYRPTPATPCQGHEVAIQQV